MKEDLEQVKCEECKHYVDREDAQKVEIVLDFFSPITEKFYCPMHIKPYNEENHLIFPPRYFARIEVNEKGEVLKKENPQQLTGI